MRVVGGGRGDEPLYVTWIVAVLIQTLSIFVTENSSQVCAKQNSIMNPLPITQA